MDLVFWDFPVYDRLLSFSDQSIFEDDQTATGVLFSSIFFYLLLFLFVQ